MRRQNDGRISAGNLFLNFPPNEPLCDNVHAAEVENDSYYEYITVTNTSIKRQQMGRECGTVGRVVASNIRGLWFESSHRQYLY